MLESNQSSKYRTNWRAEAACDFSTAYDFDIEGNNKVNLDLAKTARKICRKCPVILDCLKEAIDKKEPASIWGGLMPHERDALKKSYSYIDITEEALVRMVNERIYAK